VNGQGGVGDTAMDFSGHYIGDRHLEYADMRPVL
jgi:hypothetical protein